MNIQFSKTICLAHTFIMKKKKILKAIIYHRTCGTCRWWQRNRPGERVKRHKCVRNHIGSARLMEAASGVDGIRQMIDQGTPVDTIEGDGDSTVIARIRDQLGLLVRKKFDRNHVVKNVGKALYSLQNKKVKISKSVIEHLKKCLKYAFAKNQGEPERLSANLKALVPHQFGDHSLCQPFWCGYKRLGDTTYKHRSLPYQTPLKNPSLREALNSVFSPVINRAVAYSDLGSSQQCEAANKEVMLRANKHIHFGNTQALDFRVKASAAYINEGRKYLSEVIAHS